jgi:hypothetical protein
MEALQDIFLLLQTSVLPVPAVALVQAFGWNTLTIDTPNDPYEFLLVLLKFLQKSEEGMAAYGLFMDLFWGELGLQSSEDVVFWSKCVQLKFHIVIDLETGIHYDPRHGQLIDALKFFCYSKRLRAFQHLPPVLLVRGKFYNSQTTEIVGRHYFDMSSQTD